jgi:cytochrome c551/c552
MKNLIGIMLLVLLSGCGGAEPSATRSPRTFRGQMSLEEQGAALFVESINGQPACSTCHALDETQIVGPGMAGISERAKAYEEGAEAYLRASILTPAQYIVEGYADVMPKAYHEALSEREVDALVAFLMAHR